MNREKGIATTVGAARGEKGERRTAKVPLRTGKKKSPQQ